MVCDIVSAENTLKTGVRRANKLAETMEITREGEVLADTKASSEKALVLLKARDFTGLSELIKEEFSHTLSTAIVREQLGGRFKATVAISPKQGTKKAIYALKSARIFKDEEFGEMVEIKVTPEGKDKYYTYVFNAGSNVSHPSKEGNTKIRIERFKFIHSAAINGVNGVHNEIARIKNSTRTSANLAKLNRDVSTSNSLGDILNSSANYEHIEFKYKKNSERTGYTHGDVTDMKNVLSDLNAIGNKPTDAKTYEYYDKLLGSMHQHFFRNMDLYINENENHAAGWVAIERGGKDGDIMVNASKTNSGMSNAEVYMHEVIHTMTYWALKNKNPQATRLKQQLNYLRAQAYKNITWQDLEKADSKLSPQGAKQLFNYMFTDKNADDEFLAHALTNPAVMKLLGEVKLRDKRKPGLFNVIRDFFSDLMNSVMGSYKFSHRNSDVRQEVHALALMLGEVNGKARNDLKTNVNPIIAAHSMVEKIDGKIEDVISGLLDITFDTKGELVVPENMTTVQQVMFFTKFFAKAIYNTNYRHEAGRFFTGYGLGAKSSVREAVRSVLPAVHQHLTIAAEFLGLSGTNIDRARNNHVANTTDSIINGFKTTLIDSEQEALTAVILEANGSTLFTKNKNGGKGYSTAQIAKLIGDVQFRERVLAKLKSKIANIDRKDGTWIIRQAEGLGIFMATGKGHKAQNTNSSNIVKGYLSNVRRADNDSLLALVEEIASLTAIGHQGSTNGIAVSNLLKTEENGVRNVVRLYEAFKDNAKRKLFKDDAAHQLEGYIKQLYDGGIETIYAVMSEKEELEKKGFVLRTVSEANDLSGAEAVGFFVSDGNVRPERLSGAVSLGNPGSRGMTLKEVRYTQFRDSKKHAHVWFEADKAKYNADAVEINNKLSAGVSIEDIEEGPVPVLDSTGSVVDYRNMMPKRDKAKYLKQNRKVIDVLAKTSGTVIDKIGRVEQNKRVLGVITKNLREVHDNEGSVDNQLEYTYISAKSYDPEMRKLFFQMPKSFQRVANSRKDKSLPIPDILMDQYFGYSQLRLTDMAGVRNLPESVKRVLNMIEKVWVDVVKIAKGNILLKMPIVLVKNIVSNLLYTISTGTNPVELAKAYFTSIRDVHKLMQNHKALESKKVELMSLSQTFNTTKMSKVHQSEYTDEVARLRAEIKRLEEEGKEFESLSELLEMGMYQAVIEDVNMYKLGDTNSISDSVDKITKGMPKAIKTPLQVLFLSKETEWYRANQYILQMSDLVARDVMNKKMKMQEQKVVDGKRDLPLWYRKSINNLTTKRAEGGMGPREKESFLRAAKLQRHTSLLKSFINYASPNGRGEEWLNRIGVLMFTKYIKRIQQVIATVAVEHPVTMLITLAAAGLAMDLEMIQDSSFLARIGNDFGLFGITPIYNPYDVLSLVLVPPLVRLYNEAL